MAVEGLCLLIVAPAAFEPPFGEVERLVGVAEFGSSGGTFVQGHHDVRADDALDVHHIFGREEVLGAVDLAAEMRSFFGELAVG